MEFKEYNLIECVSEIIDYRGKTPKKLGGEWDDNGDYRAISAKNIKNNKIVNEEAMKKVNKEIYMKWMKKEVKKGDILLTSEAPLGETYYWDSEEKIVLSQRIYGIRANENIIKSRYLFAYMQSRNFSHELTSRESGTTVTGIRQSELEKVKIKIPVLSIQKYIGDTIFNLNQKIQVNSEIINTLEKISQTLFKQWFIDFEFPNEEGKPYKSSGGEMVESELGEIPKLFEIGILKDFCELKYGKSLTKKNRIAGMYPVYGSGGITGTHKEYLIKGPGLIVGRKGSIGTLYLEFNDFYPIDTVFYTESEIYTPIFLYQLFKQYDFTKSNNDSAVPGLNRDFVYNTKAIIPNYRIVEEFEKVNSILYKQINNLLKEIASLTQLRDTLLPKLLSGEIEIPDDLEV